MNNTLTLHGANPKNLYTAFNITMPEKVIDFSTNTNIISWPQFSINLEYLASHYPDPDCLKLREFIASRESLSVSRILITNGTNEAIFLLSQLFPDNTAILQPSYTEYSRAFRKLYSIYSLDDIQGFKHVIIINPNNPTGKFIADLSLVIGSNPDKIFIIDEAYIDFLLNAEPERLCEFENVIILRSLTKIYHLSGLRIGYVIASEKIISSLRGNQPSWSVNGPAQELGLYFLRDKDLLERTRTFYRTNTPEFMGALREAGFEVMNSDVHYFLMRVEDDMKIIEHLLRAGIVVRHTRNFAGLDGKYIRVATRTPAENKLFIEAVKSCTL